MSSRKFYIAGALRLVPKERSKHTLGVTLFGENGKSSNMLFAALEDRRGVISNFVPIEQDSTYELFECLTSDDSFLTGLDKCEGIEVGSRQIFAFFANKQKTFYRRSILASEADQDKMFLSWLRDQSDFSSYSAMSALSKSMSQKVSGLEKTQFAKRSTWKRAEISFFQHSDKYWRVVEQSNQSARPAGDQNISTFRSKGEMLDWLMKNAGGFHSGDQQYKRWVGAWLHLSEYSIQREVIETLGAQFISEQPLTNPDVSRILRRLTIYWLSDEGERALSNWIDEMTTPHAIGEYGSLDGGVAVETHALITRMLFKISLDSLRDFQSEGASIQSLQDWLKESSKVIIPFPNRIERYQRSNYFEWISASIDFALLLRQDFPRAAISVVRTLHSVLSSKNVNNGSIDDFSEEEILLSRKAMVGAFEEMLESEANTLSGLRRDRRY